MVKIQQNFFNEINWIVFLSQPTIFHLILFFNVISIKKINNSTKCFMFELRKKFSKGNFLYNILFVLQSQAVSPLSLQRQHKSNIINMSFIILSFIDSKQSIMSNLSERLTHLRGLIAGCANISTLLFETDKIISLEKQLRNKRNQIGVDALQQEIRVLKGKLKETRKESKSRQETIENLKMDLEIIRVKCKNLEERVKENSKAAAREKRTQQKRKSRNCTECEIQVDLLPSGKIDELLRIIRSEIFENQNLGHGLEEIRLRVQAQDREESHSSNETRDDQDFFELTPRASYHGSFATVTPSNPETEENFTKNQQQQGQMQIINYGQCPDRS